MSSKTTGDGLPRDRRWHSQVKRWLCLLLVPEVAFGYFLVGMFAGVGGFDWGWALMGAGMGVMFGMGLRRD